MLKAFVNQVLLKNQVFESVRVPRLEAAQTTAELTLSNSPYLPRTLFQGRILHFLRDSIFFN